MESVQPSCAKSTYKSNTWKNTRPVEKTVAGEKVIFPPNNCMTYIEDVKIFGYAFLSSTYTVCYDNDK